MEDIRQIALTTSRTEFARRYPCLFLIGADPLTPPRERASTDVFEVLEAPKTQTGVPSQTIDDPVTDAHRAETPVDWVTDELPRTNPLFVAPLTKRYASEPDRIWVGRVSANDVIISDAAISRRHAFFRVRDDHVTLADAGAANGTMVNGKLLEANGSAQIVVLGDRLRFAHIELVLADAVAAWDRIHHLPHFDD